jgi:hypothetical protein
MVVLLCIGLHLFLLSMYSMAITRGISRHSWEQLLFAAFVPFVGEACLLASEFGDAIPRSGTGFRSARCSDVETESLCPFAAQDGGGLSREELLSVISSPCSNINEVLVKSLSSSDSEVVHIAASAVMRRQRDYEAKIKELQDACLVVPQSYRIKLDVADALGEYAESGLAADELRRSLLDDQADFILQARAIAPKDAGVESRFAHNCLLRGNREDGILAAESLMQIRPSSSQGWILAYKLNTFYGTEEETERIKESAEVAFPSWSFTEKRLWTECLECCCE